MTANDLGTLNRMLEMGMWDNQQVQALLDTLDSEPSALLPHAMNLVAWAAFLLTSERALECQSISFGRASIAPC